MNAGPRAAIYSATICLLRLRALRQKHLLFELRARSDDSFQFFGRQPPRCATEHVAKMTQVLEFSRKTNISKRTITRYENSAIRFRDRHPGHARGCGLVQFRARLIGPLVTAVQEFEDHIIFCEQCVLIVHPARESETRPTARAAENDPHT